MIYGGISYTTHPITQIWYPSSGVFTRYGVLTGAYNYTSDAEAFGALSLKERLDFAAEGIREMHPAFDEHVDISLGLSVAWQRVPYQRGGWAGYVSGDSSRRQTYRTPLMPEGDFHLAGDQVSQLPGWQEGAVRSADWAVAKITESHSDAMPAPAALPASIRLPDTRRLTQGRRTKPRG